MTIAKTIDTYQAIIHDAWQKTMRHPSWWIVAALAGLAHTGVVFNAVFNTFWRLRPADAISTSTIEQVFPFVQWFNTYLRNLVTLPTDRLLLNLITTALIAVLLLVIILLAQQVLVLGVKKRGARTQPFTWRTIKKDLRHLHIVRLFTLNAGVRLLQLFLLVGPAIPLTLLLSGTPLTDTLAYTGIYLIILPLTFAVSIIGMLAILLVIQKDLSLTAALTKATHLTHKHWLLALELALILFVIHFLASIGFYLALFLLTIGTSAVIHAAFASGTYLAMSIATFLGLLLALVVSLVYAGALSMFNYSCWSEFLRRVQTKIHLPVLEQTLRRLRR